MPPATSGTDVVVPLPGSRADTVDAVAAAVLTVPGVVGLHGGTMGEVGTYLAGRRVLGVRLRPEVTDVHVTVAYGAPVRETAGAVRTAVSRVVPGPVDVTVEDVSGPAGTAGTTSPVAVTTRSQPES